MTKLITPLRHFTRRENGAVAIEFVLLAPLLFGLLFGIVVIGYAMALSHSVQQLAGSSARASVAGITTDERRELAQAYLDNASANYPLLVQSSIAPTVAVASSPSANIRVDVRYAIDGSIVDLASGILGIEMTHLEGSAYLAY
ncbi:TadE/TadG family type IV pilus assembly protein [Gymnodinialimonas ceratoperidinii]|uniref:Pilus assembly protein n=1 Tax=Gymnodinialimonas ceratoperidinii TaxID=2856823 RepID=A0A8F6YBG8_9RHOB|nr:TadE/TadG family type IV pilus assembly protein [Gymnodinialimonas ceratoperidinii]QXT38167.1 pilus assembly protein [Gymnodinialimonas ceratoperidinii]